VADAEKQIPRFVLINRNQFLLRPVDVEGLIDEEHPARSLWHLVGSLDLSAYQETTAAVEGGAGRPAIDPQLLVALWLYGYSKGISSDREIARQCEHEPGFSWLCGLEPVNHHTLSNFRAGHKAALDDLFKQVLGLLSAEGLITLERVTQDGTKIRANASGNTFRRAEALAEHLKLAEEQVRWMEEQSQQEEQVNARQAAAQKRARDERLVKLRRAQEEVERLQKQKKHDRDDYVARASITDPEAHLMRPGEGGAVPAYNVPLTTDTEHGLVVGVAVTTDAIDDRQWEPALDRVREQAGRYPAEVLADGDYTNHASVQAAAARGVDFYGSWKTKWEPGDDDAFGRSKAFQAKAFLYSAEQDRCYTCPAGQPMVLYRIHTGQVPGGQTLIYRAAKSACQSCPHRLQCGPKKAKPKWSRSISRQVESAEVTQFKSKMATAEAQAIYRMRSQIAEFPHAWIKQRCGVRQFRCRGTMRVACEAMWACLSYNLSRWFALKRQAAAA
jgi:transposase